LRDCSSNGEGFLDAIVLKKRLFALNIVKKDEKNKYFYSLKQGENIRVF
jgi:hypothetical protein